MFDFSGVVKIKETFFRKNCAIAIMEFFPLRYLSEFSNQNENISELDKQTISNDVREGIRNIHSKLDDMLNINPQNIKVIQKNGVKRALIDVGIIGGLDDK